MTATLRTRRLPRLLTAGVCALAAVCSSILVVDRPEAASAAGSGAPSVGVPAYFWPGSLWTQLLASGPEVQYIILNPESGPGSQKITGFADAVTNAKGAGKHVVAYVDTAYGARPISAVKADIDAYRTWYGVNEFFLDQTPFSCETQTYYDEVRTYINTRPGGLVVLNPGVNALECWMTQADVLVNFEGSEASYANWTPAAYTANYPSQKFWQIVYAADPTHGDALMATAQERRAGVVFITDDTLPNPFDTLPSTSLWNAQVPSNVPATTTTTTTTVAPTTAAPTTVAPTTAAPTTVAPTTAAPTTVAPTTAAPTTAAPTTAAPTTAAPTTVAPTTAAPTTAAPTTAAPTTAAPTTAAPTTAAPTTTRPPAPTTAAPTTAAPTTAAPTTAAPTTAAPTTVAPTTRPPAPTVPVATTTAAPTTTTPRTTVPPVTTTAKPKPPVRTTTTTTKAPKRITVRLATNRSLIAKLTGTNRS